MIKLLITGAEGQLGRSFTAALNNRKDFIACAYNRMQLDITDAGAIDAAITRDCPDFVINTAAYTLVDQAEAEKDLALQINQVGPANLAQACDAKNIPIIHFSTDYVFDGSGTNAWIETDSPAPLNQYGASKLGGEREIQSICQKHLIFRTSWLFSPFGDNFVRSMLRLGAQRTDLAVVNDQIGKPTCTFEIVRLVLEILPRVSGRWGLYHLAQPEAISWYGFAKAIFAQANQQNLVLKELSAIGSADYPVSALRPKNSELDCKKLQTAFNVQINPWQQSLIETLRVLQSDGL